MKYNPRHFDLNEFRCRCCGRVLVASSLVFFLDLFRKAWGAPVLINSAYRCERHNREVGGALRSRHLLGCAADIRPSDSSLIEPFKLLLSGMMGAQNGWEMKIYQRFVHIAVPREEAVRLWSGDTINILWR